MNFIILKPRDNNIYIGSGAISRRVVIKKYRDKGRRKRKTFMPPKKTTIFKSNKSFTGGKSDKAKSRLHFPSSGCKIVFLHWQRTGFPFVKHKEEKSIITTSGIQKIQMALKKNSVSEVVSSIDKCHTLFSADWFKHRTFFDKKKISLPNFFRYPISIHRQIARRVPDCPKSWHKECHKNNFKKLKMKYSVFNKDKNPAITKQLIEIWKKYNPGDSKIREIKNFIKISNQIAKAAQANRKNKALTDNIHMGNIEQFIITIFEQMLLTYKTFKPTHLGWLVSDIFLNETIPKEIIRQNLFTKAQLNWKKT